MKKKIILAVALALVVALCAVTMVACTPTDVGKYLEALKKSDHCVMKTVATDMTSEVVYNGGNIYMKMTAGAVVSESYYIVDGTKKTIYTNTAGVWSKQDMSNESNNPMMTYSPKEFLKSYETDKTKYDIKEGAWTHKEEEVTFTVVKGALVLSYDGKEVGSISLDKQKIELPAGAKALDK